MSTSTWAMTYQLISVGHKPYFKKSRSSEWVMSLTINDYYLLLWNSFFQILCLLYNVVFFTYLYFCPGSKDWGWVWSSWTVPPIPSCLPSAWLKYCRINLSTIKPYSWLVSWITIGTATAMAANMNPKRTEKSRLLQQQQHPRLQQALMVIWLLLWLFITLYQFHAKFISCKKSPHSSSLMQDRGQEDATEQQKHREWFPKHRVFCIFMQKYFAQNSRSMYVWRGSFISYVDSFWTFWLDFQILLLSLNIGHI